MAEVVIVVVLVQFRRILSIAGNLKKNLYMYYVLRDVTRGC